MERKFAIEAPQPRNVKSVSESAFYRKRAYFRAVEGKVSKKYCKFDSQKTKELSRKESQ